MKGWWRRWGPSLPIMTLIFTASSLSSRALPDFGYWHFDIYKGGHMAGYALLGGAYLHALAGSKTATRRIMLLSVLLSGLYAITDEVHQLFTPGRHGSPVDVGIDMAGAAVGILIWTRIRTILRRPRIAAGQP